MKIFGRGKPFSPEVVAEEIAREDGKKWEIVSLGPGESFFSVSFDPNTGKRRGATLSVVEGDPINAFVLLMKPVE